MNAKETIIRKNIKPESRYRYYLKVISSFMIKPLPKTEIDILEAIYMEGSGEINQVVRTAICETLYGKNEKAMSIHNLNNYIIKLRKKKLIIGDHLSPNLMIDIPADDNFEIKIILIPTI